MTHVRGLAAVLALALIGAPVAAPSQEAAPAREAPIETLKSAYLACERAAVSGRMAAGDIMRCSVIYEELKQRAFGGDFERLKVWADEHLHPPKSS